MDSVPKIARRWLVAQTSERPTRRSQPEKQELRRMDAGHRATDGRKERREGDVPPVSPAHIAVNREDWIENRGIEFYVDFETLNSLNDDFGKLPRIGGTPMIFMIGCGHEEDGAFMFKVWTPQEETH
jgi:hypothetical protein